MKGLRLFAVLVSLAFARMAKADDLYNNPAPSNRAQTASNSFFNPLPSLP